MHWFLCVKATKKVPDFSCGLRKGFNYQQSFSLINSKLKWVKDKALDAVIAGERDLRAACNLVSILSYAPNCCLPIYKLSRHRGQLGLILSYPHLPGEKLPYTSSYADVSHLDPRTDVSEKRIVGVFHELLLLTIQKKTERKNVSNLRKPLSLPQKLRDRFASMMRKGFLDKSRGLYKKTANADLKDPSKIVHGNSLDSETGWWRMLVLCIPSCSHQPVLGVRFIRYPFCHPSRCKPDYALFSVLITHLVALPEFVIYSGVEKIFAANYRLSY
ncbi:hypothetical protein REPUB_Repub20aG0043700 [Reevesia pubescens]